MATGSLDFGPGVSITDVANTFENGLSATETELTNLLNQMQAKGGNVTSADLLQAQTFIEKWTIMQQTTSATIAAVANTLKTVIQKIQ